MTTLLQLAEKAKERAKALMIKHNDEEHTKLFLDINGIYLQLQEKKQ